MFDHFDARHIGGLSDLLGVQNLQHVPLLQQLDDAVHSQDVLTVEAVVVAVQHEQMLEVNDIILAILMKNMTSLIQSIRLLARVYPNSAQCFLDPQEDPWPILVQLNFNHTINDAGLIVDG